MNKFVLILFCLGGLGFSQDAEAIMEKASKALGSEAAFDKISSSMMQGRMSLPQGMEAKMTTYEKEGGKMLVEMKAEGNGMSFESRQGCDGTDCFAQDNMMGLRLLEGQEKEAMMLQNGIKSHLNWRDLYEKLEYQGTEDVNGRKTHKIHAVSKDGMSMVNYYDAETYLLLRSNVKQQSVMGLVDMALYFHDYKTVEGIKYASRMVTEVMGQNITVNIDSLTLNIPIPDSKFAIPAGLK